MLHFFEHILKHKLKHKLKKNPLFSRFFVFRGRGALPISTPTIAVKSRVFPWFAPFCRQVLEWRPRIGLSI